MVAQKIASLYSLRKSRRIFLHAYRLYNRKKDQLDPSLKERFQTALTQLRIALLQKEAILADRIAHQIQALIHTSIPKTTWDKSRDFIGAIAFALVIAILIRQMWFEFYTIPTGSMRPTLKEGDYLVVSKNDYGINIPLQTAHFYFDPSLVQRGSIVVFTGEHMDISDADTTYFYLFPGKKQFVKRLIGKPGDTLYFYGGQIYGVSANGKELTELREAPWAQSLEHIPYIRFDGKIEMPQKPNTQGLYSPVTFYQMNEAVAKLSVNAIGTPQGELTPPKNNRGLKEYSDLWGFKNFAMARLLTEQQVKKIHPKEAKNLPQGILYLELTHHPSLKEAQVIRDEYGRIRPDLGASVSLLPLQQEHIDAIANHLTTCRFQVKEGLALRYGANRKELQKYLPSLPEVPDGTYEIQNGIAYEVHFGDVTTQLPLSHPLYQKTPEQVQLLYNLGIEFLNQYIPSSALQRVYPSRYAYFRNHDLYLLGAPIVKKDDPALTLFIKSEYQKQLISTSQHPYAPFDDAGAPLLADGSLDTEFILKQGLTIPPKTYLVLGDNHAMSADSRQFGFVPEDNLKGGVSFLFWPPGDRWGKLPQPSLPLFTLPSLFVLGSVLGISLFYTYSQRRKITQPLKF